MSDELKSRSEVPENLTWNLKLIYENEDLLWQDADTCAKLVDELCAKYKGQLYTPEKIVEALKLLEDFAKLQTLLGNYSELALSVDYYNTHNLELSNKLGSMFSEWSGKLSFVESEISGQSEETLKAALENAGSVAGYLREIIRGKKYKLHPEAERVLASYGEIINLPYAAYEQTKLMDIVFDDFEVDGKKYPLGYSLFEDDYEYEKDAKVRRAAFDAFSRKIRQYSNVTACVYNAEVKKAKLDADLRGFDNLFDGLLFGQNVTREMYDRQIDTIMEKLAPHMRRYAKLLKHIHGLEKMTYADLKISVDPDYDPSVSMEESRRYIRDGLSVMGPDYQAMIDEAYDRRWVDFARNKGKSTGGFCASPYGKNSFILLTWNNRMADVFTLAHELGHAGHFKACNSAQSIFDTEVSTYFVESPSTMNEILMSHYLLKTNQDKRFRRWVLSSMVSKTYYHNFVTHLLEAAYQREVYRLIEKGESVHAGVLNKIMKDTLQKFWGDDVEMCEGAELTWMRQPHYYMGLYSYTYSAGLTIATEVCRRIETEGQPAVDDWKRVLQAGSTKNPMELAEMAGVDISTDIPLLHTIEYIGGMIDEICSLTEELEHMND